VLGLGGGSSGGSEIVKAGGKEPSGVPGNIELPAPAAIAVTLSPQSTSAPSKINLNLFKAFLLL
jgi:hypothetical protein